MIENRFKTALETKKALSIFFTAGYPRLNDTLPIISALTDSGADLIEIGFPFSDPISDGPTIQESSQIALKNGMSLKALFKQLSEVRSVTSIPLLLMGYINPVEQYGFESFLSDAARCGVDGAIIPDMPFDRYQSEYKPLFKRHGVKPVFLVTTRTPQERIKAFDQEEPAFLYLLSSDAVTGGAVSITQDRDDFFRRVAAMGLKSPLIVGFGVRDRETFNSLTRHTNGAIIGSAFTRALSSVVASPTDSARSDEAGLRAVVKEFIEGIR
jgi:tryptophan synthase alpha chain